MITDIIRKSGYLLDFQKEALICQIERDEEEGLELDITELLDTLLFRLFNSGIDGLSPMERVEVNIALRDLGYKTI